MITLTHFSNGNRIALNLDLIEKIEETPDTVITLTNGARYLVQETIDEIVSRCDQARARITHIAHQLTSGEDEEGQGGKLRLLQGKASEPPGPNDEEDPT